MFGLLTLQIGNLIIYNPRREDSGNYSCSPSNLDSASVVLHVLSGQSQLTHFSIYTDIAKDFVRLQVLVRIEKLFLR